MAGAASARSAHTLEYGADCHADQARGSRQQYIHQSATMPPSTPMTAPAMKDEPVEQRNITTVATSCGSAKRPMGVSGRKAAR